MNLVLGRIGHLGVEFARELDILVHLIRLDLVEHNGVDIFASSQDLAEAGLHLGLHLSAFLSAIDEVCQRP